MNKSMERALIAVPPLAAVAVVAGAEGVLVDSIEGISTLRETNANQSSVRMFEGAIRQAIEHHTSLLQSPTIVGNVG